MRQFRILLFATCAFSLLSCASMHKSGIANEDIPADINSGKYKVLYTQMNLENITTKNTAKVNNDAARKHVIKRTGDPDLFVAESDIDNEKYSDVNVYRYVLLNRVTAELTKTYYRGGSYDGQAKSYILEFYFLDRVTGKEYPHVKGTTMPLYMLKAIVDKVTGS